MTILVIAVILLFWEVFWALPKRLEGAFRDVFLRINFNYQNFYKNGAVKEKVIPYLTQHGYSETKISALVSKEKKWLEERKKNTKSGNEDASYEAAESRVWWSIFSDLVEKGIHKNGNDKYLGFRIINRGADRLTIMDYLTKDLYSPKDGINFEIPLIKDDEDKIFSEDYLTLNGATVTRQKNKKFYRYLMIYMYVHPKGYLPKTKWYEVDKNVLVLAELPYELLYLNNSDFLSRLKLGGIKKLLKLFNLEFVEDKYGGDVWGPDEIGNMGTTDTPGFTVGNDLVNFWII